MNVYDRTVAELFVKEINLPPAMIAIGHAEIDWRFGDRCSWAL